MDSYHELASAVIMQAVKDYRLALKQLYLWPDREEFQQDVAELERFFISDWFQILSNLDGPFLMKRVQKMVGMEVVA